MTRILIPRGSAASSSSSNQNRSSTSLPVPSPSSAGPPEQQFTSIPHVIPAVEGDDVVEEGKDTKEHIVEDEISEHCGDLGHKDQGKNSGELSPGSLNNDHHEGEKYGDDEKVLNDVGMGSGSLVKGVGGLTAVEGEIDLMVGRSVQAVKVSSHPPPPPVPPPKPSSLSSSSKTSASGDLNAERIGSSRRPAGWPGVSSSSSPTGSEPSSPQSHCEGEGYNSADEQRLCFSSSCDNADREHQFEIDLKLIKGLDVRKMLADGNCLFRAVADQVYGDSERYNMVRKMCIDYMMKNRDHFSEFITEDFTSYCKRKRMDKVYGNNMEIQALSEMYNRPIHIYSYSLEPINIFHGSYETDTPPIRLSYHHGNHYNSLVDPHQPTTGAGLGFSSLQGRNVDKDQVKAAIKAQQNQQIDNALLAEGRLYSDLDYTEKEIERMVMEASRAEYLAGLRSKQRLGRIDSSTSVAEPSSSATRSSGSNSTKEGERASGCVLSDSFQIMLSMGFSYMQVIEAYSIYGDDVDSMVEYIIETSSKGKATK